MNHIVIAQISAKQTYPTRHQVLREGKPIESTYFEGDHEDTTYHLGAFDGEQIIGVVTLMTRPGTSPIIPTQSEDICYQLRGMAVHQGYQNTGIGSRLIQGAEDHLRKLHPKEPILLWCNAREKACNFYRRHKFITIGPQFDIKNIGPHFKMYKWVVPPTASE